VRRRILVATELELELDGLLQAFEAPFALFLLEGGDTEELCDGIFRVAELELLGVVVLVLNVDVVGVVIIVLFVLEIVPAGLSAVDSVSYAAGRSNVLLIVGLLHKILVVGHLGGGGSDTVLVRPR
jgi:hypothetical protein